MEVSDVKVTRANGYGQYFISGVVEGIEVKVRDTNSECFDWIEDDSNPDKHQQAKEYANNRLCRAYEDFKFLI